MLGAILIARLLAQLGPALLGASYAERLERLEADTARANEIATELVLGLETVKTHVRNVLAKLGVRDRVQAVITAYESGFIH